MKIRTIIAMASTEVGIFRNPSFAGTCSLQVESKQAGEDGVLVDGGGVGIVPAVGIPDGAIERGVGVLQPSGAGIVEVGEGALLQLRLGGALGVQPVLAQLVEPPGRLADRDHARVIDRLLTGRSRRRP
jgi:hypothetical protein